MIATKNRCAYLAKALTEIRALLTDRDELIVADGGSTDGTAALVEANRDIVSKLISEPDRGEAHAFNKALLVARGEFIKFLTDDDIIFKDCMERAVSFMESDPSIDALQCGGEHYKVGPQGEMILDFYFRLTDQRAADFGKPVRVSLDTAGTGLGLVMRRRALALTGLLETSFLCVDTEFLSRLKRPGINLKYFDGKLYRHIDYPHSGVMNRQRANADAVRVFIRAQAWEGACRYETDSVARGLGLDTLEGGDFVATLILRASHLRRTRMGRAMLGMTAGVLRIALHIARLGDRLGVAGSAASTATPVLPWPREEPKWTHQVV